MNLRLFAVSLLLLLLVSCTVNIDPRPAPTPTPRIDSVTLNGQVYSRDANGQANALVASSASDVFVVQAKAQDFSSLVINVLRGAKGQKNIFASTTCAASDPQPCKLTLPTQAQWKPEDKGYYDISVKAVNTNSTATRDFPKWLLVFLE